MYPGYLLMGSLAGPSLEVINTHRAVEYAQTAGLNWVKGCNECEAAGRVTAPAAGFQSPHLDNKTGDAPPWWDGNNVRDSQRFLGLMGVSIEGMDDSTRTLQVTQSTFDGGYLGSMRFKSREVVVRAVAIATDDCALGFGINWLRNMDTGKGCFNSFYTVYECCPCLCGTDCTDAACLLSCTRKRERTIYEARIAEGPSVLRRRVMPSGGAMAEVEFTIYAGEPGLYGPMQVGNQVRDAGGVPYAEPQPIAAIDANPFTRVAQYGSVLTREPVAQLVAPRVDWLRETVAVPGTTVGQYVAPVIHVTASQGTVEDVRVALVSGGTTVASYRIPMIPNGGTVTVSLARRKVTTEWGGVATDDLSYITAPDGSLVDWPGLLAKGSYEVVVDRPTYVAPVTVQVDAAGWSF